MKSKAKTTGTRDTERETERDKTYESQIGRHHHCGQPTVSVAAAKQVPPVTANQYLLPISTTQKNSARAREREGEICLTEQTGNEGTERRQAYRVSEHATPPETTLEATPATATVPPKKSPIYNPPLTHQLS
jgi:hypothetical protein